MIRYRIKVTYWLVKLGGFGIVQAWKYSAGFIDAFYEDSTCARDDVLEDFSYYD